MIDIDKQSEAFYKYMMFKVLEDNADKTILKYLLEYGDVLVFGGVIKDYLLEKKKHRDIDYVVESLPSNVNRVLSDFEARTNSFGGLKFKTNTHEYDLWEIKNTWAIKKHFFSQESNLFENINYNIDIHDSKETLPSTAFFNLTAIIYSLVERKFYYHPDFKKAISKKRELDIVFNINPIPELCIVKSFEYFTDYQMKIGDKLKNYIIDKYPNRRKKVMDIQKVHYGKIKYSKKRIEHFYNELYRG